MMRRAYVNIIDKVETSIDVYEEKGEYFLQLSNLSSASEDISIPKDIYEGLILAAKKQAIKKGKKS